MNPAPKEQMAGLPDGRPAATWNEISRQGLDFHRVRRDAFNEASKSCPRFHEENPSTHKEKGRGKTRSLAPTPFGWEGHGLRPRKLTRQVHGVDEREGSRTLLPQTQHLRAKGHETQAMQSIHER